MEKLEIFFEKKKMESICLFEFFLMTHQPMWVMFGHLPENCLPIIQLFSDTTSCSTGLDKSGYQVSSFPISLQKHMLWVPKK